MIHWFSKQQCIAGITILLLSTPVSRSYADVTVEDLPLDPSTMSSNTTPTPAPVQAVPAPEAAPNANQDEQTWIRLQKLDDANKQLLGQLEDQAHEIQLLKQQIKEQYLNMDKRLSTMEGTLSKLSTPSNNPTANSGTDAVSPTGLNTTNVSSVDMEKQAYLSAYEVYRDKGSDAAIPGMLEFVHQYPQSVFLPHAQYWLGEFYLNKQVPDLNKAASYFETVVTQFPRHAKAPAALYNLGLIHAAQHKTSLAITTMHKLIKAYPKSAQVQPAQDWLSKQKKPKHEQKIAPEDERFLQKVQTAIDQFDQNG